MRKEFKPLSKAVVKKIYAYETKEDWQFKFYKVKIPTYLDEIPFKKFKERN